MFCRPITIENSRLLKLFNRIFSINFEGFTFYPFILLSGENTEKDIYNHELIHIQQTEETFFIGYILILVTQYTFNLCKYRNLYKAYRNLAFEKEAYDNMKNLDYLKSRKKFAWLTYFKCK